MTTAIAELIRYRDLFRVLVERQLKLRVKRSLMGAFWPAVSPYFLMLLYIFVFKKVFDVPVERYPEFLLAGLLPWGFLTQTLGRTILSISGEPTMIRKGPFPYELMPLSVAASHAVNFLLTMAIFVAYLAFVGHLPWATLPALVFPLAAVILLVMSLSMIVALVDVYTHDLQLVLSNILTIWFFLVPIVYTPAMAPGSLNFLDSIDPMNLIVTQTRAVLYFGEISRPDRFVLMFLICSAFFLVCLSIFRRFAPQLPKDV